jgi:serine/threonine-protein phosphatase 2A regulatory subunit A
MSDIQQPTLKSIIADLQSQESKVKTNAIHNIPLIIDQIGQERFRKDFLPYLINCLDIEEDDCLLELSKDIVSFIEGIGGKNYIHDIFPLLETILHTDDSVIRKEINLSIEAALDLYGNELNSELMKLINELSSSEDNGYQRNAVSLIGTCYGGFNEKDRKDMMKILREFLNSNNQMVKIELVYCLKKISCYMERSDYEEFFNKLINEKNDTVRFNLMDTIENLKNVINIMDYGQFLSNVLPKLANDESWRTRLTFSEKLPIVCSFGPLIQNNSNDIKNIIINSYAKIIEDQEAEVRTSACRNLEMISEVLGRENNFVLVLSKLKPLSKDSYNYVRSALASNLLLMCPFVDKKLTNDYIYPIFVEMIKDNEHDIRMVLIKNLDKLHEIMNIDNIVQEIIPSLIEISNNKNWRIRNQIAETIPVLARILNKKIFMENILNICIKWLNDPVYAIRETACKLMKRLYDIFKGEDFEKKLLSKLSTMIKSDSYLVRITVTILIKEFANDEYNYDFLEKKLFPYILRLSRDKIANVRMNCVIILKKMNKNSKNRDILKDISSTLEELKRDRDIEVIYAITDN